MAHKTALVLSGGGARGAYQVGVLKALAAAMPNGTLPFPILTGVSVGALNASVLAAYADNFSIAVERLEAVWRSLHCEHVYKTDRGAVAGQLLRWGRAMTFGWAGATPPQSLLDNSPLRELLETHVDFDRVNRLVGHSGLQALAITASSYETGRAVTFYKSASDIVPWERARRIGARCDFCADHIMASSALPLIFPAIKVNEVYYGDGALRENAPLSAAIHLGCERILTIGARDGKPDSPAEDPHPTYPSAGDLGGHMLDILFNDNIDADVERLTRINGTVRAMRPDTRAEVGLRDIAIRSINPSRDIREIAGQHADELPISVKTVLKTIGAMKAPYVLPSYLTFEPGYIHALIDLGFADAQAQIDDLTAHLLT